jgi:hypothetical protein
MDYQHPLLGASLLTPFPKNTNARSSCTKPQALSHHIPGA